MTQPVDDYAEARAMRDAQVKEWGQFVAATEIDINGVRAFNPGDPVPVTHVNDGIVSRDAVVGAKTKTAAVLTAPEKG